MADCWLPYQPTSAAPWDWRRVVHLHRRAGFGATWNDVTRDVAEGPQTAIERMLWGSDQSIRDDFDEMSNVIGDAAVSSGDPNRLKAWWLYRMLFSPHPLQEKLTLLWHNHFATSNLKVENLGQMKRQNELFRKLATARFGDLLPAVVKDPAILVWLDANSNRKGHPNENLGRELMELFTLGIGHYTEDDVKQAARALTGWTVRRDEFQLKLDRHDDGAKTILGQTETFDGDDLLQLLLKQPATSQRIAWRLCSCLMGENVADEKAIDALASGLRDHQLDIGWAVKTVLQSQLFFSDQNITSRVSGPVEYIVGTVRSLELFDRPPSTLILAEWCTRLGQDLFFPPNVGGWSEGRSWLSSRTIVGRSNFAAALTAGQLRAPTDSPNLEQLVVRHCGKCDHQSATTFLGRILLGREVSSEEKAELETEISGLKKSERFRHLAARILSRPKAFLT